MVAVYLNVKNQLIGWTVAYTGGISGISLEPRGILAPALLANASGIVVAHNHPSGDPSPSREDIAFTRRLADGGDLLGVVLLDHLVIGDGGRYTSLRRQRAIRQWGALD